MNKSMIAKISGLLVSLLMIAGGFSGVLVLRGTNSSTALVIVGFAWLAYDIYLIATHKKADEPYRPMTPAVKTLVFFVFAVCLSISTGVLLGGQNAKPNNTFIWLACFLASFLFMGILYLVTENKDPAFLKSRKFLIWSSFWITALAMTLVYAYLGVHPAGTKSVAIIDMHFQFIPFFSSLAERVTHGSSMLYSFNLGIGGSFLPMFAYYLASPFNLIFILLPHSVILEATALITILKLATASAGFAAMLTYIYKRRDLSVPIIAIGYGLMSYFITYAWVILWIDAIALTPFVIMGLHKLIREGKFGLYAGALSLALISNYYIGAMLCLYSVLYFIVVIIGFEGCSAKQVISRISKFVIGSLAGGMMAMFMFIPTYLALGLSYAANDKFARALKSYQAMAELYGRQLFTASPSVWGDSPPNIYVGLLPLILLPLFLMSKTISARKKVGWCFLLGFLAISFNNNWLNFMWHGFHFTSDLNFRYAFLFSFTMLAVGYQALIRLSEFSSKQILKSVGIMVGLTFLYEAVSQSDTDSFQLIYVSVLLFALYAVIMIATSRRRVSINHTLGIVLMLVCVELVANGCIGITELGKNGFTARQTYIGDYDKVQGALHAVHSVDDDFYRLDMLPDKMVNSSSWYGYRGLNTFASTNNLKVNHMMKSFGFANNGCNSYMYRSFVAPVDSLFSMKYLIFTNGIDVQGNAQLKRVRPEGYEGECSIYENTMAAPLGFVVSSQLADPDENLKNPFAFTNLFYNDGLGAGNVFTPIYATAVNSTIASTETNSPYFVMTEGGTATFMAAPATTGQYYLYVDCHDCNKDGISVSCPNGADGIDNHYNIRATEPFTIDLGTVTPDQPITISITSDNPVSGNIYIAKVEQDVFERGIATARASGLQIEKFSDHYIKGRVNASNMEGQLVGVTDENGQSIGVASIPADGGQMLTSIGFDPGWRVKVDGKRVPTKAIAGFLSFDISSDEHTVEMRFFPSGLTVGLVISGLGLALYVALILAKKGTLKLGDKTNELANNTVFLKEDFE